MGVLVHPNALDHLCPYKIVQPSIIQDNFFLKKKTIKQHDCYQQS